MSKIYSVDFKKLILLLMPTFLRKPLIAAFANAAVIPLVYTKSNFNVYRKETDYRLYHNGQVCHLCAMINDQFDPIARRITIADAENDVEPMLIYKRETDFFKIIPCRASSNAVIINRGGFSGVGGYDFVINIPVTLRTKTDKNRLRAITNAYKLASKRYNINYN